MSGDACRAVRRHLMLALAIGWSVAPSLEAQAIAGLDALRGRLDPASWSAVSAMVDSAQGAGLPANALVSKAQEGVLKRASGPQVVTATRALLGR
nr:hypothetical protein [Gemmatimonadaceae bacterium]